MKRPVLLLIFLFGIFVVSCRGPASEPELDTDKKSFSEEELRQTAKKLSEQFIVVDTHIDVPFRLMEKDADISQATEDGDFDYPRAVEGGLNAAFMSIYLPASYQESGGAKKLADDLIDMVAGFEQKWPERFAVAYSVSDVREQFRGKVISLPMGMENGAGIEGKLENLQHFYDRGIRYITLAHSKANQICDSSYDPDLKWNGLSPFGREVVAEMNRLGIMVDISHVSDDSFYQVMEVTRAPAIASHSSCRRFTPGWERNMSDDMIRRLAENGGVIQINFGSSFLNDEYRRNSEKIRLELSEFIEARKLQPESEEVQKKREELRNQYQPRYADIQDVVAHIDHVVELVGIDHVGLGSDFDGVGDSLPYGLKDVSDYPNLIYELLRKGYSEQDIEKICSGNLLRVWSEVENIAAQSAAEQG